MIINVTDTFVLCPHTVFLYIFDAFMKLYDHIYDVP